MKELTSIMHTDFGNYIGKCCGEYLDISITNLRNLTEAIDSDNDTDKEIYARLMPSGSDAFIGKLIEYIDEKDTPFSAMTPQEAVYAMTCIHETQNAFKCHFEKIMLTKAFGGILEGILERIKRDDNI
jgi:hypothetical protein